MKTLETHRFLALCCSLLFLAAVMPAGIPETAALEIVDNPTGGDCAYFGDWNVKTKTCMLTADLVGPVEIMSNGITLAGNEYSIRGNPADADAYGQVPGAGVMLNALTGVAVTHVTVENFQTGIYLSGVTNSAVTHSHLFNTWHGIQLDSSYGNEIIANDSYLTGFGILLYYSGNNMVAGNIVENSHHVGIYLNGSDFNDVVGNQLAPGGNFGAYIAYGHFNAVAGNSINNTSWGLRVDPYSEDNIVMNNNFLYNSLQAVVYGTGNTFTGNHWADYDTDAEGCSDSDSCGHCDNLYPFYGGADTAPHVAAPVLAAETEVFPGLLNAKTRGKVVSVYIEVDGYTPADITVESVRMVTGNGHVLAYETPTAAGDFDSDGVPDLMVKFNKELVKTILNPGLNDVVVAGVLADNTFEGRIVITLE